MYKVLLDGKTLWLPGDEEHVILSPEAHLSVGDAGYFTFNLPPINPYYKEIVNRSSMVQVLKNGEEIFYGEVREQEKDSYNNKRVYAVGELAFLFDSVQPRKKYQDVTVRQFLEELIAFHNEHTEEKKHFQVGIVTIHDANDSMLRYTNREMTLDAIREKLVEKLGGVLRVRKVNGIRYLDYIQMQEYGKYCKQEIVFGENLFDYSETLSANDVYTAAIPLGARLDPENELDEVLEKRVDITSVNNGVDYVYSQEAVNAFGWVTTTAIWDDVHIPSNLITKGRKWLEDNQFESLVLSLKAVDQSIVNADFEEMELGDRVKAVAAPYGMNRVFPVQSLVFHLQEPEQDTIELGDKQQASFTSSTDNKIKHVGADAEEHGYIRTKWLQNAIDNATAMMTGSNGGYKLSEFDESGRWLRDLYMDAPNKDDAKHLLQINMNGIGFSRTGYAGPYLNAWTMDGTFLGEFIKAHSIKGEALETEYIESVEKQIEDAETGAKEWANDKITTQVKALEGQISLSVETERLRASGAEEKLSSRITVNQNSISSEVSRAQGAEYSLGSRITQTENSISSEVTRAKNAESNLSSLIRQTAEDITLCVKNSDFTGNSIISKINLSSTTATIAASKVNINADDIRLQANKSISWSSTYSSMSANGKLTCESADIRGTLRSQNVQILDSEIVLKNSNSTVGKIMYGYFDGDNMVQIRSADKMLLKAKQLWVCDRSSDAYRRLTRTVRIEYMDMNGGNQYLFFVNGMLVNQ